jgi:hypothetical protein
MIAQNRALPSSIGACWVTPAGGANDLTGLTALPASPEWTEDVMEECSDGAALTEFVAAWASSGTGRVVEEVIADMRD